MEKAAAVDSRIATEIDLGELRAAVDATLRDFLDGKAVTATDPHLPPVVELLRGLVTAGGKRLRPLLCLCGWAAAGGSGPRGPILRAAAALELFHMFALIHDDVIDGSGTRRGRPTVHHLLARRRREVLAGGRGPDRLGADEAAAAARFGESSAILVGDLALVWSDELLYASGLDPYRLRATRPLIDEMRTELMLGQYLDLLATRDQNADVEAALAVVRYKSAKYTVERPLQIGAALAGAGQDVLDACTAYALPVGEAFQLRDDLLGVFGDPAVTGKPRLDDLRDGKATVLLAYALRRAGTGHRDTLLRLVGDPALDEDGAAAVREILTATGAAATVEDMIAERRRRGLAALDEGRFHPSVLPALRRIAHAATARTA